MCPVASTCFVALTLRYLLCYLSVISHLEGHDVMALTQMDNRYALQDSDS